MQRCFQLKTSESSLRAKHSPCDQTLPRKWKNLPAAPLARRESLTFRRSTRDKVRNATERDACRILSLSLPCQVPALVSPPKRIRQPNFVLQTNLYCKLDKKGKPQTSLHRKPNLHSRNGIKLFFFIGISSNVPKQEVPTCQAKLLRTKEKLELRGAQPFGISRKCCSG
jgi:hypothetical protein